MYKSLYNEYDYYKKHGVYEYYKNNINIIVIISSEEHDDAYQIEHPSVCRLICNIVCQLYLYIKHWSMIQNII